jgi:hypothetical protein
MIRAAGRARGKLDGRQAPRLVRPLTDGERDAVAAGLRSSNAYIFRRSEIVAASARGEHLPRIARGLGGNEQTVRNAIHAFNQDGRRR